MLHSLSGDRKHPLESRLQAESEDRLKAGLQRRYQGILKSLFFAVAATKGDSL